MFEKILVISEPMPNSEILLKTIIDLKKIGTRECLLFQCLNPRVLYETPTTFVADIFHTNLESQKKYLEEQGFIVATREAVGYVRDEIVEVAREENCALIVAGASEQSLLADLLFGNAAYSVMHGSTMPLMIVRVPGRPELPESIKPFRSLNSHVLFPTDFSENAARAFAVLKQMVEAGVRKITLLHVQDKAKLDPHLLSQLNEFNRVDAARLRQMADELKVIAPVDVTTQLLYGSPTTEILRLICDQQISLVIMGSQGRGYIKEVYLGSVSHNVARHAVVSVLLIPAER